MSTSAREPPCTLQPSDEARLSANKVINDRVTRLASQLSPKAPEGSLTHDIKSDVKALLITRYHEDAIDEFRREIKNRWTSNQVFPVLDTLPPAPFFKPSQLKSLHHKATILYWPASGRCSTLILCLLP